MLTESILCVDEETGELVRRTFDERRPRRPRNRDFVVTNQPSAHRFLDKTIHAYEYRLYFLLVERCAWANIAKLTRKEIATALETSYTQVWRSLEKLKARQFIFFDKDDPDQFLIDPWLCWRGAPEDRAAAGARYYALFRR